MRLTTIMCLLAASGIARAATITVNSTLDTDESAMATTCDDGAGHCTLRAAITFANRDAAADTIQFALAGSGVHTFTPASSFPSASTPMTIDATTQTGYAGVPLVEIDGTSVMGVGLSASASLFNLKGFSIYGFGSTAIDINGAGGKLSACYIGLTAAGVAKSNHAGVFVTGAAATPFTVGGTSTADRNVISGNDDGVMLSGAGADVVGNYIGPTPAGNASASATQNGVVASSLTSGTVEQNVISGNNSGVTAFANLLIKNNLIGLDATGTTALGNTFGVLISGTNSTVQGNTISGNATGIDLTSTSTTGNVIAGNFIGTNATGTLAIGNMIGIRFDGSAYGNTLGGMTSTARNLISGNQDGVSVQTSGTTSMGNMISGNWIGLDANGGVLGNTRYGVDIGSDSDSTVVGGMMGASTRNVISGNGVAGVHLSQSGAKASVFGNYIGTSTDGMSARPNGVGVIVEAAYNVVIGDAADGNLISGNTGAGVQVVGSAVSVDIAGNTIGLSASGSALPNKIGVEAGGPGVAIGGPSAGNKIWFNTQQGVLVDSSGPLIQQNSIGHNSQLGIDIAPVGENPNSMGSGYDHPVLTAASTDGTNLYVSGTLSSESGMYVVELFSSMACDPSGYGQGETYLGNQTVMISPSGGPMTGVPFVAKLAPLAAGTVITATSTLEDGTGGSDTSEFSGCVTVKACPSISVGPATLPPAQQLMSYMQMLSGSGGASPYVFSVASGALPSGLMLDSSGDLSGTPLDVGTFSFTVATADANGCGGSQAYQLVVSPFSDLGIPDASVPSDGGASTTDGGASTTDGGASSHGKSGCGCELGASPRDAGLAPILLATACLLVLRRRKARA